MAPRDTQEGDGSPGTGAGSEPRPPRSGRSPATGPPTVPRQGADADPDVEFFARVAVPTYEQVAAAGHLAADDARLRNPAVRRALTQLVRMGLLAETPAGYEAVDPATAHSAVVAPLGREGLELLVRAEGWARSFATLGAAWRKGPAAPSKPLTEIRGEAVLPFLASIVHDAEIEVLAAQPEAAGDPAMLEETTRRHVLALQRGVRFRVLYQHAARRAPLTHGYVTAVTEHGAEARTLDEFFDRVILVDRKLAVVPGETPDVAVVVREPALVAHLTRAFERAWSRGRLFEGGAERAAKAGAEQRAMTIRMLLAGLPDNGSAKRLGVSPRTYAAYVAELKNEFGVGTRFQLGHEMGRRGITGDEEIDPAVGVRQRCSDEADDDA